MDKLNAATAVKKKKRNVRTFRVASHATPRNNHEIASSTRTDSHRKRAVWYGTDCYYAEYYQAADICWEDDSTDADSSLNAEILWADTYVSWNDQATAYTDIIPMANIVDNNWLRDTDNFIDILYDTDADGLPDVALVPDRVAIKKNKSVGMNVIYYVESQDEWYYQAGSAGDDANCYATLHRYAKANHWAAAKKISWWQASVDWTCLFDDSASEIGWAVAMEDYWGTDLAPDDYMETIDYVSEMNYPLVTDITPRRGYDRAGGEIATMYGENLYSIATIWERYEDIYFDANSDTELEFETLGGVGCTDIDIFNDDWYVWYQNAICYQ